MTKGIEGLIDWINTHVDNEEIAVELMKALFIGIGAVDIIRKHDLKHELDEFVENMNEEVK